MGRFRAAAAHRQHQQVHQQLHQQLRTRQRLQLQLLTRPRLRQRLLLRLQRRSRRHRHRQQRDEARHQGRVRYRRLVRSRSSILERLRRELAKETSRVPPTAIFPHGFAACWPWAISHASALGVRCVPASLFSRVIPPSSEIVRHFDPIGLE